MNFDLDKLPSESIKELSLLLLLFISKSLLLSLEVDLDAKNRFADGNFCKHYNKTQYNCKSSIQKFRNEAKMKF